MSGWGLSCLSLREKKTIRLTNAPLCTVNDEFLVDMRTVLCEGLPTPHSSAFHAAES